MNNNVIEEYINGKSISRLEKEYKISYRAIRDILVKENIFIRGCKINHKEVAEKVCSSYLSGKTLNETAKDHSIAAKSAKKILKENNIELREIGSWLSNKRQSRCIDFNFDFFKERNDLAAYYGGILISDGCLKSTRSAITLGVTDSEITYGLAEALQVPMERVKRRIKQGNRKPVYELVIQHSNFVEDLKYWGIQPRKTHDFLEPIVETKLLPAFLRGWFDGDGSISLAKSGRTPLFRITGNHIGLLYYQEKLKELGYNGYSSIHPGHSDIYGHLHVCGIDQVKHVFRISTTRRCRTSTI